MRSEPGVIIWGIVGLLVVAACGRPEAPAPPAPPRAETARAAPSMDVCAECHADVVAQYREHGMARSLGPLDSVALGTVVNPLTGMQYTIQRARDGAVLTATTPGGGLRAQRLVGRIGAGLFDTSWAGEELDPFTGDPTGRLFFAPVEQVTGQGLKLAPFEQALPAAGLNFGLGESCLTCHTTDDPARLPGAARAGGTVFPSNALGGDAFQHLQPIGCDGCHGDARAHVDMMEGRPADAADDLVSLARLPAPQQRDVCARCHLQGDARMTLQPPPTHPARPLAGMQPALVPVRAGDDFRFVGQLERLALSACFRATPAMTCTTCHDPHTGVRAQGTERFDAACQRCHEALPMPHTPLTVEQAAGTAARSPAGCVDCHMRRSQPFDLPHVRAADHFIRSRIPPPEDDVPHRTFADPAGPVTIFDDGRLAETLRTPEGRRWKAGATAMGLVLMGRFGEAARGFEAFPPPGSVEVLEPGAPAGLTPLETTPLFHRLRGLALMNTGRPGAALLAFTDALELDPGDPGTLLDRARLRVLTGDLLGAFEDTERVAQAYPGAAEPWDVRALLAMRSGQPALAVSALEAVTARWPSDAGAWMRLSQLYVQAGRTDEAAWALDRARQLRPEVVEAGRAEAGG